MKRWAKREVQLSVSYSSCRPQCNDENLELCRHRHSILPGRADIRFWRLENPETKIQQPIVARTMKFSG